MNDNTLSETEDVNSWHVLFCLFICLLCECDLVDVKRLSSGRIIGH